MIYERDKPAAILLESSQPSQYIQTTNKSSKLPITKLSLVGKWFKYPTLSQEQQTKSLAQNANLNWARIYH